LSGGSPSPKDEVATRRKSYLQVVEEVAVALAALDSALMVLTAMAAGGGGGGGGDPAQGQGQARSECSSGLSGPG